MAHLTLSDFIGIGTLLLTIISLYLPRRNSQNDYKMKKEDELKNIAKALESEIQKIEKSSCFSTAYILCTKYPNDSPTPFPCLFYNKETGLYFTYKHDITKLNSELSTKIYTFYDNLINAENIRSFIAQNHDFFEKDVDRTVKYYDMKRSIKKCGDLIPELKEELEKVQNQ